MPGTLNWLCNPDSEASSNYLVDRNGDIYELVPPNITPWTNGKVCKPDLSNPLIKRWVDSGTYANAPTVTIEHVGFSSKRAGGSLTAPQITASVALTAWLCDVYRIPPDRQHILGHYQLDDCTRHNCPGFSAAEWRDWIGRVAALVRGGQPVDEQAKRRALIMALADSIPYEAKGELVREGSVNLSEIGGAADERLALFEKTRLHTLKGRAYAFNVDPLAPYNYFDCVNRSLVTIWS